MKAFITIKGVAAKEPKIKKNSIDMVIKTSPCSKTTPNGLKPIGETICLAHMTIKQWEKVSKDLKKNSVLIIKGDLKAALSKRSIPFIELNVFHVDIEGLDKKKKEKNRLKKFYEEGEVQYVSYKDIVLKEKVHLEANTIKFGKVLNSLSKTKSFSKPLVVKRYKDKYSLIVGMTFFVAAKILEIEKVPIVIRNTSHEEFMKNFNEQYID